LREVAALSATRKPIAPSLNGVEPKELTPFAPPTTFANFLLDLAVSVVPPFAGPMLIALVPPLLAISVVKCVSNVWLMLTALPSVEEVPATLVNVAA